MSDFNDDWQLVGTPDPATPQVQPHQTQVQRVTQQSYPQQIAQPVKMQTPYPQQPAAQPVYKQSFIQQPYQQSPFYNYGQAPIYQQTVDYGPEREANLAELNRLINHFSPHVDLYQQYEKCNADITKFARTSVAPLVWGIILLVLSVIYLVISVIQIKSKNILVTYTICTSVVILAGAGLIALYIIKKKRHAKKYEELIIKSRDMSDQLFLLYNGFSNCQLAPEYTDPRILFKLQSLILTGRCFTIFQAMNAILSISNTYMRINKAKAEFTAVTAARYDGIPSFFNAARFINLR